MNLASLINTFLLVYLLWASAGVAVAEETDALEIVRNCYYKHQGDDQRSKLIITLRDEHGKEVKHKYIRLWKDYKGVRGVVDKVILFTMYPPWDKGVNFMRWGYTPEHEQLADQWVYLPETRKVRRVSERDPQNMDWYLRDEDLRIRALDEDTHRFINTATIEGETFYVVESIPHSDPLYSKRVFYFSKTEDWDTCLEKRVDYYDKHGKLLKRQTTDWIKIKDAWVWDVVDITNMKTRSSATYEMKDTEVNIGLTDDVYSKRNLRRGYRRNR